MKNRKVVCDSDEDDNSDVDSDLSSSSCELRDARRDGNRQTRPSPTLEESEDLGDDLELIREPAPETYDASNGLISPTSDPRSAECAYDEFSSSLPKQSSRRESSNLKRSHSEVVASPRKKLKLKATKRTSTSVPRDQWDFPDSSESHSEEDWDKQISVAPKRVKSRHAMDDYSDVKPKQRNIKTPRSKHNVEEDEEESDWEPHKDPLSAVDFVKKRTSRRNGEGGLLEGLEKPRRNRKSKARSADRKSPQSDFLQLEEHQKDDSLGPTRHAVVDLTADDDLTENVEHDSHANEPYNLGPSQSGSLDLQDALVEGPREISPSKTLLEVQIVKPKKKGRRSKKSQSASTALDEHPPEPATHPVESPSFAFNDSKKIKSDSKVQSEDEVKKPVMKPHPRSKALTEVKNNSRSLQSPEVSPEQHLLSKDPSPCVDSESTLSDNKSPNAPPQTPQDKGVKSEAKTQNPPPNSPLSSAKVPLRVGLSKRARIQPLLRMVRK
ncbi:MAG: hypothetical protein M4579_005181 [Chaenotheca gracillima]|nr:MAG: hypothetical protein M4579_005181 [Chaenotheca gracillima]